MVSVITESDTSLRPSPADFDTFLPWASGQMQVEYNLIITRTTQGKYVSRASKEKPKPKPKTKLKTPFDSDSNTQVTSDVKTDSIVTLEENPIFIETTYNENNELVRLKLLKNRNLPQKLFKIIALVIPYHTKLTSLIVNDGLHARVIYEMSHFFSTNRITEICLDYTKLAEANYHILLDNDIIKHFSLSKCGITDVVVKTIASKLARPSPASTSLSVLNLSTNRITDVGARYLAEMLRSNRQLSYLNLADNKITDEGAKSIFNTLTKFPLTSEETLDGRRSLMSYLYKKNELVLKTVKDLRSGDDKKYGKRKPTKLITPKKKLGKEISADLTTIFNMEGNIFERAESIAEYILGPFNNPFSPKNTEKRENFTYCLGNNTLSYLNLAFNNLSYCSVKKLCEVLKSQNILCRNPKGLINIRIEGNCLPKTCTEFQIIDDLLLPGLAKHKNVESVKKKGMSTTSRSNS